MFGPLLRSPTLCEVDGWSHDGEQISTEALPVPLDITSVTYCRRRRRHRRRSGAAWPRRCAAQHCRCQVHVPARGSCAPTSSHARPQRQLPGPSPNFCCVKNARTDVAIYIFFSVRTVLGKGERSSDRRAERVDQNIALVIF